MFTNGETYCILIEVKQSKDNYTKVHGYDILTKDGNIKLITIVSVNELKFMLDEKVIRINPYHKMSISEKMNFEILKAMVNYGKNTM